MARIKTHAEIWGAPFPVGGEWDAGSTPLRTATVPPGRWTVRREEQQFVVVFKPYDGEEIVLKTFLPTDQGEVEAKTLATSAFQRRQVEPEEPLPITQSQVDYGYQWYGFGTVWRVSWDEHAGILYAECLRSTPSFACGERMTLADLPTQEIADTLMDGWAEPESPIFHNLVALHERIEAIRSIG